MQLSRRHLLATAGMTAGLAMMPTASRDARAAGRKTLRLQTRVIEVNGKPATRYGVFQGDKSSGLFLDEGDTFDVRLENGLDVLSGLHWHGLNPPWRDDGVPYLSAPPIAPGKFVDYSFPAQPPGTRWMHSHFGLQEQNLLAAPLIVREKSAIQSGLQEVVMFLEDFSWTRPSQIFEELRKPKPMTAMGGQSGGGMSGMSSTTGTNMGGMNTGGMNTGGMNTGGMNMGAAAAPDLNDVTYDAFLANERTLADPDVVDVDKGAEIRLRIINAGASSNFMIDLGNVEGTVLSVDGNPVTPLAVRQFPIAIAQRVDIRVRMPADGTALPVLARCEGRTLQTGLILRPRGAPVAKIPDNGAMPAPAIGVMDEMKLRAAQPLPSRPIDRSVPIDLIGNMSAYSWGIAVHGQEALPVTVDKGERVELVMRNTTMMSHPMHVHGPSFQVTEINGQAFAGAVRDVVLVPPRTTVKVVFDADNPGMWAFHCHNLYHMAAGMFATVVYRGFS